MENVVTRCRRSAGLRPGVPRVSHQPPHFLHRPLPHLHHIRAPKHRVREQPVPPASCVADAPRNPGQAHFQSCADGVGQHECGVEAPLTQPPRDAENTLLWCERDDLIHCRMSRPQPRQLIMREQHDVRIRQCLAQSQQRGCGHDSIANPVHAAHQETARIESRG